MAAMNQKYEPAPIRGLETGSNNVSGGIKYLYLGRLIIDIQDPKSTDPIVILDLKKKSTDGSG